MKKVLEFRAHANECRKLAALMDEAESRGQLLQMAESWEQLADERERLVRLRGDPAPQPA